MKVIKKGRPQKGWSKEFKCTGNGNGGGGCKATLLIEKADLFFTHGSHYDGSNETYTTFECCQCGVITDVSSSLSYTADIPHDLPDRNKWKAMKDKSKETLRIELDNQQISDIVAGKLVRIIMASDCPDFLHRYGTSLVVEIAPEKEEECSKCGRVYCY